MRKLPFVFFCLFIASLCVPLEACKSEEKSVGRIGNPSYQPVPACARNGESKPLSGLALPVWCQRDWPDRIVFLQFPAGDASKIKIKEPLLNEQNTALPEPWIPERKPAAGPSFFAGTQAGIVVLVAGIVGWLVLAISVFILEHRKARP